MLEKRFQLSNQEQDKLYQKMLNELHNFKTKTNIRYCIMMPPPNINGVLHMGHALTYTLQDILIRYHYLKGAQVLWQSGTDHASIATQIAIERQFVQEGINPKTVSKEAFLDKAWEWKDYATEKIVAQQKKLGIFVDWDRSRFTLDEHFCKAVNKVFKKLYDDGLIYKDKRLVNWDFKLKTALSDLEVVDKEFKGKLYYIRYSPEIVVATTRPETLFGDSAVAVHPDDERFTHLVGSYVEIPICKRMVKIIADRYCDPQKGSGAVKITPAHDFNDFEVGCRADLDFVNILDESGHLNENVPLDYRGLSIEQARNHIVQELNELGIIEKIEDIIHQIPVGDRTGMRIEPLLMDQWFIDAKKLAAQAIQVVEKGEIRFIPENWKTTYIRWLENIRPWCISRQLLWGHQIPVWYGPEDSIFVECDENSAYESAKTRFGPDVKLRRDEDVLDTWFSAGLWPFVTLGWPDRTEDLEKFFPTSVLVTGFDIIFFWVARMIMMSLYFMKTVPFKDVYIHALVRDSNGQKMSKSKGNVIDPMDIINEFGIDTLRFTLCGLSVPGRDINLGSEQLKGYQHFLTKLWNAGRFLLPYKNDENICLPDNLKHDFNLWIVHKFNLFIAEFEQAVKNYRFDLIVQNFYSFFWSTYCDIYLEGIKPFINDEDYRYETIATALTIYINFLKVCWPIMPFIVEKLNQVFGQRNFTSFPKEFSIKKFDYEGMEDFLSLAYKIRSFKSLLEIYSKDMHIKVKCNDEEQRRFFETRYMNLLKVLTRIELFDFINDVKVLGIPFIHNQYIFYISIDKSKDDIIDLISSKILLINDELKILDKILMNERFKINKPDLWQEKFDRFQKYKQQKVELDQILNIF